MPDHIHLLVRVPTTLAIATLMKQIKGVSSAMVNALQPHRCVFRWQEGYAVFSVCPSHLETVTEYIRGQKQHHAEGRLNSDWEEVETEI
jgi:REP element-mobilizing transposase RayT